MDSELTKDQTTIRSWALDSTRIPLTGTSNLRDLGDIPTLDGRVLRKRRVYRAEVLAWPDADPAHSIWDERQSSAYRALGVRTVVDLRSQRENRRVPSAWPTATGARCVAVPIEEGGEGDTGFVQQIRYGRREKFTTQDLTDYYRATLRKYAPSFGAALRLIARSERLPVLVHCTAGKDRTGLLVALLLDVLGVSRDLVVEEYALTGTFRPNRVAAYANKFGHFGVDLSAVSVLFESPPVAMEAALADLDKEFGSVSRYLLRACGLDQAHLTELREQLLAG